MSTSAAALRAHFLAYFHKNGHVLQPSAPLVPHNDPTLLFVNAGMVPFKDIFVGSAPRPAPRAVSCQKCMRVSGKHNDLEEVGRTARHHTFFEMLGNFSFADYFKEEAISFAWQFLSKELQLPPARLWVTVFGGSDGLPADHEAAGLWKKISSLPETRILPRGLEDNFWQMGETGPCGPCTEIYVDYGTGPLSPEDFDNGRLVEIWNNVFMQFERQKGGALTPLAAPCVDTGMGLERVAAFLQGERSNYHSDLFAPLLARAEQLAARPYGRGASDNDVAMRVIADHARATAFLVADGIQPSNEGRGYVLRRIMRRAIRHGRRLQPDALFLPDICAAVVTHMGEVYPELVAAGSLIDKVTRTEEETFARTLQTGMRLLNDAIGAARTTGVKELAGDAAFRLYDTYGFPPDLTAVVAAEQGMAVDMAGFEEAMRAQQARSRGGEVGEAAVAAHYREVAKRLGDVAFVGYVHEDEPLQARPGSWRRRGAQTPDEQLQLHTEIAALLCAGQPVDEVNADDLAAQDIEVVLNPTPLYGEAGGQVGDVGSLDVDAPTDARATVLSTHKPLPGLTVSRVHLHSGQLRVGMQVWAGYSPSVRGQIRAHHSATHLLHAALRDILGDHIKQAGSYLDGERLRFDYTHFSAPDAVQLEQVEADVNARVQADDPAVLTETSYAEAKALGAMALFGEKYGERVRLIAMGRSVELCGGTHVRRTSEVGLFLVVGEQAVQSGIRRIEACVGSAAQRQCQRALHSLQWLQARLQGHREAPPAEPGSAELSPALAAVERAMAQYEASLDDAETGAEAGPAAQAFVAAIKGLQASPTPTHYTYAEATAQAKRVAQVVRLSQARPSEHEALLAAAGDDPSGLLRALAALWAANAAAQRHNAAAAQAAAQEQATLLLQQVQDVRGMALVSAHLPDQDAAGLRQLADSLRPQLPNGVVVLASVSKARVTLLVAVGDALSAKLSAAELIKTLAPHVGGRGGGKASFAQAGGNKPDGVAAALAAAAPWMAAFGPP